MSKVNVYDNQCGDGPVVARVQYNSQLDRWNGSDWSDGGVGTHLGITQLRDGRYVLIHGTQWQGCRDWAEVVTDQEALQAVLKSSNEQLLELPRFKKLQELAKSSLISEIV